MVACNFTVDQIALTSSQMKPWTGDVSVMSTIARTSALWSTLHIIQQMYDYSHLFTGHFRITGCGREYSVPDIRTTGVASF
jgi:hypothetical protein